MLLMACNQKEAEVTLQSGWKQELQQQLPLLGHRNWILVVDKAFPLQNADGVITLDTEKPLLDVLNFTLKEIQKASHVKPIIYTDKELGYLDTALVPGIEAYRESLKAIIGEEGVRVLLHDSVFLKIDEASKLFQILVLKTNETIPYSSVFLELDCQYWSPGNETKLRELMAPGS
jgi:D-ribose pyranose/furanose isomerase RbsD